MGWEMTVTMTSEIEQHITKRYEIKKRLGKGVSVSKYLMF